jgi:hypothetical protein
MIDFDGHRQGGDPHRDEAEGGQGAADRQRQAQAQQLIIDDPL